MVTVNPHLTIDPYQILGVPRTASRKEIQSAYRARAKQLHPDLSASDSAAMAQVNNAYDTLKDPVTRQQYDSWSTL